jgi:hypothetical protein
VPPRALTVTVKEFNTKVQKSTSKKDAKKKAPCKPAHGLAPNTATLHKLQAVLDYDLFSYFCMPACRTLHVVAALVGRVKARCLGGLLARRYSTFK